MFCRNPEGKPAPGISYSWMKTTIKQWNGIYRGKAKKPIFSPKFSNCVVKLSFHHPSIKSTLLDSLNLTTAPQTMLIISFIVIPHCSDNGQTGQISCTLTTMAISVFVLHRFFVFFLYKTNKQVSYQIVIILVETMQWFKVSLTNLIQFINCLLWSVVM